MGCVGHLYIQGSLQVKWDRETGEDLVSHSTASWADTEAQKRFCWTKGAREDQHSRQSGHICRCAEAPVHPCSHSSVYILWPEFGEENPCLLCGSIMGPESEECAAGGNADDFMFFL